MTAVQQPVAPHPAVRQRIDWIDTAKGLCMILVIVGHTLPYGNLMRNFIFSFHMPAFFFLTGYTARRPDTWQGLCPPGQKRLCCTDRSRAGCGTGVQRFAELFPF